MVHQSSQLLFEGIFTDNACEAHEDDPAVDWRTQANGQTDEIEDSDLEDVVRPVFQSRRAFNPHRLPARIREAECIQRNDRPTPIHRVYLDFVVRLCQETSTQDAEGFILQGLPTVVSKLESIPLDEDYDGEGDLVMYSLAMVVHVWQLVCLKMLTGEVHSAGESLSTLVASYFLAAEVLIAENSLLDQGELKLAVEHWEERLVTKGGTSSWLLSNLLKGVRDPDQDAPCYRNDSASEYLRVLEEEGLFYFALYILRKEESIIPEPGSQASPLRMLMQQTSSTDLLLGEMIKMLLSMDIEIIKAIIQGQLQRKSQIYHSEVYNRLRRLRQHQPGSYMNGICDARGNSPTPAQWLEICDHMLAYVGTSSESNELAADIDQLIHPAGQWPRYLAAKGLRRYTEWREHVLKHSGVTSPLRRRMVKYFVSQLQQRLSREIDLNGEHTPLTAPVVEVGFSLYPETRLKEHRHHSNSNYLMNLAQACFEYEYPGMFQLQQLVVFTCWRPEQCWLSEMFITRLAQGYVETGGGFSHYRAGFSNGTAYRKVPDEVWDRLESHVLTPEFERQFDVLIEQAEEAKREREKMAAYEAWSAALTDVFTEIGIVEAQFERQDAS